MPLPSDYMRYPKRRHGMDHDLYPWSNLFDRKPIAWPGGAKVALWITPVLEFFPLTPNDKPFRAPGAMVTPYPDYRTYTTRDYGNRVGIFRILKVLDRLGLKASVPINAALAEREPLLLEAILKRGHEVIAHGRDMNTVHAGGMAEGEEREIIKGARETLRRLTGQEVGGWLSPARSESAATLSLLAEAGFAYHCDWLNDDLPYRMTTPKGAITAMPHTQELDDRQIFVELRHSEATYEREVQDAFEWYLSEAERHGGRILHLNLTPYVIGQPFRIKSLSIVLEAILNRGSVWNATGAEIFAAWQSQPAE